MKQPGLDKRHRDADGTIDRKHGNTRNENLPRPIPGFGAKVTLSEMRVKTGKESERAIRAAMTKGNK
jgi:hypothetical protein